MVLKRLSMASLVRSALAVFWGWEGASVVGAVAVSCCCSCLSCGCAACVVFEVDIMWLHDGAAARLKFWAKEMRESEVGRSMSSPSEREPISIVIMRSLWAVRERKYHDSPVQLGK